MALRYFSYIVTKKLQGTFQGEDFSLTENITKTQFYKFFRNISDRKKITEAQNYSKV